MLHALRKDPVRRYDGAAAFAADLARHRDGLPIEARPESATYRAGRFVRRHRVGVLAAAAVLAAVVGGVTVAVQQAAEAERQRAVAEREAATSEQVATFMTDLFRESNSAEVRGDTVSARDLLDEGLARVDSLRDAPDVQADLLNVLGDTYRRLGRFEQANAAFERVVAIRQAQGDSMGVVQSLYALATARSEERAFPEAIAIYRAALARADDAPDTLRAALTIDMGIALVQIDELDQAIQALDAAAPFIRRTFPADATESLVTNGLRAQILVRRQEYGAARRLHERNIRYLRASGDESGLANSLNDLAFAIRRSGDPGGAVPLYREALSILERIDREGHRNRSIVLNNIASASIDSGDLTTAESALLEKLDLETANQGPGHWRIGSAHEALGGFYIENGRPARSVTHHRQSVAIYSATLGPDHTWTAKGRGGLALSLFDTAAPDEANAELDAMMRSLQTHLDNGESFGADVTRSVTRVMDALDERGLTERAQTLRQLLASGS